MKTILYVSAFSRVGGGEISILTIIKNVDPAKYRTILVTYQDGEFPEMARGMGIETIIIQRPSMLSDIKVITSLIGLIKRRNIDMLHVNSLDLRAGIAASIAGVPFIGHLRVIYRYTWRDAIFVRFSRVCLASSRAVIDEFCLRSPSLRDKFTVLYPSVNLSRDIVPADLKMKYDIPADSPIIGAAGRIDPWKGFEYFIDAAAVIIERKPDARFFLAGEPDRCCREEVEYFAMLQKRIALRNLEGKFFLTGFKRDILNFIAALDIVVIPSCEIPIRGGKTAEGFGRVALEAMALGIPVVASASGGLKETVADHTTGLLVPAKDPKAIADAVLTLLQDSALMTSMTDAAKKRFHELYLPAENIKKLEAIYNGVLG